MPHWVTVHWVRHKWECFVRTQRSDRTGIQRDKLPQDEPQTLVGEANAQHLIDTWRKRLCFQASPETRRYAEDFKMVLRGEQPELSDVLVPNCIYRCGCPEMDGCSLWARFCSDIEKEIGPAGLSHLSIQERYNFYNQWFYKKKGRGAV